MPPRDRDGSGNVFIDGGFTLIELLVTIAIIAVLAAMLLPALSRAKQQGWSARCKSNLHQMEIALRLYVDDNGGKYPYANIWYADNEYPFYWVDAIVPYYQLNWTNPEYHCPGYNGLISNSISGTDVSLSGSTELYYVGSYGYNAFGTGDQSTIPLGLGRIIAPDDLNRNPPLADSQLRAPSEMIALADNQLWWPAFDTDPYFRAAGSLPWGFFFLQMPPPGPPAAQASMAYPLRHGENYNFTCCDGHVEAMPPGRLFNPRVSAVRWNNDHLPHPETWQP